MDIQICTILLLLSATTANGAITRDCKSNPAICTQPICKISPGSNRKVLKLSLGCTIVKPVNQVWIRVAQLRRLAENIYVPGAFDFTQDICAILSVNSTGLESIKHIVKMTLPNIWTTVESMLHPCPYKERFRIDIEVPFGTDRKSLVAQMMPRGEYKTMFRLYNEKNQTAYEYNEHYMY